MNNETSLNKVSNNLFQHLVAQVGVTDEVSTCYCCGKQNLKRTVVFETSQEWQAEGGDDFVFFGTSCATKRTAHNPKKSTMKMTAKAQPKRDDVVITASFKVGHKYMPIIESAFGNEITINSRTTNKVWYQLGRYQFEEKIIIVDGVEIITDGTKKLRPRYTAN